MKSPVSARLALRMFSATAVLWMTLSLLLAQAPPSGNRSNSFGPDACGPADPAYIHTANETGGIPLFLQRSEAAKAFHLVRESSRDNMGTVLWATGSLHGEAQAIEIPVDSATQRITFTFSVNTKGAKLLLKQPSGDLVTDGTPKTENTDLNCGRIVTVTAPSPGNWRAEITGTGFFWFEAKAQSDIHFIRAEFVKMGGRPGHEGYFRIPGQPVVGMPATLQVTLSAESTQSAEFHLVNERGDRIQKLRLQEIDPNRDSLELEGPVALPNTPFRVAVVGLDSSGYKYQRFFSGLFHSESVEVLPAQDNEELATGSTKHVALTVRNFGATRAFRMTVTDGRRFVSKVEPKEFSLNAGDSAVVHVDLAVPEGTTPGTEDDVVAVASSTAGPATSNSSVVHLIVARSGVHQNAP